MERREGGESKMEGAEQGMTLVTGMYPKGHMLLLHYSCPHSSKGISYSLLIGKAEGMRAGREGGGRVGRAMGLEDINQHFALEKEAEEKETTLSITRISSRSCCAAWLQQYSCLPLLWCHWMQDCEVKIQMSKKQNHLALPLPNTREHHPGWSASQMYSSAFVCFKDSHTSQTTEPLQLLQVRAVHSLQPEYRSIKQSTRFAVSELCSWDWQRSCTQ